MLASRLITVSPFLLFSLGVIGCSSGPRAEYAPSDHAVCQPVLVVDDSGYQQGNELLFKSLILINQEMTRKDGEGPARQAATLYRKLLNHCCPTKEGANRLNARRLPQEIDC